MKLPCFIVLNGRKPRWLFRNLRIIAGPKICVVKL